MASWIFTALARGACRNASWVGALALISSAAAGATVSVSNAGTANYEHRIAVPPGVRGLAPQLSLSYSSGSRWNGSIGYGWSMSGYSTITRCAATRAVDGVHVSAQFTANDKLCLESERLIPIDDGGNALVGPNRGDAAGLAGAAFREYRTERDGYSRVRAYGLADSANAASGPAYFRVWTKDGKVIDFGNNPATSDANTRATITAYYPAGQTNHYAQLWAVSRIADVFGNRIDFKYTQRDVSAGSNGAYSQGHEWNLAEIQYSGNKIIFDYTDRSSGFPVQDIQEAYAGIAKMVSANRLASITTYTNAANTSTLGVSGDAVAVATTKLSYDSGPVTRRSRVTSIQTCAGDKNSTRCLPGTSLAYSAGGDERYERSQRFNLGSAALYVAPNTLNNPPQMFGPKGILTGDFNGDGKTDIIRWSSSSAENQLWLSNGEGDFRQALNFNITSDVLFVTDGCTQTLAKDFNGDGLVDLLRISSYIDPTERWGCPVTGWVAAGAAPLLFLNNGNGGFSRRVVSGVGLVKRVASDYTMPPDGQHPTTGKCWGESKDFYLMDVDGDGVLDVVTTIRPARSCEHAWDPIVDQCVTTVCTRVFKGNGEGNFSEIPTNLAHRQVGGTGEGNPLGGNAMDMNFDGLPDIGAPSSRGSGDFDIAAVLSRGDGNFDVASSTQSFGPRIALDYNGDGKWDVLSTSGYGVNDLWVHDVGSVTFSRNSLFNVSCAEAKCSFGGNMVNGHRLPIHAIALDLNGDGRQDIVPNFSSSAWISNGNGSFSESDGYNLPSLRAADGTQGTGTTVVVGDFTGKGTPEFIALGPTVNALYVKADSTRPDMLTSVTSESRALTKVAYVPLSNPVISNDPLGARYVGDLGTSNAAVLPKIDVTPAAYVVATVESDNGVGGSVKTEYSYYGLKADTTGRDSLGFRGVRKQTVTPNGAVHTTETKFMQDFPYIGMPSSVATHRSALNATSSGNRLTSTANVYCDQTSPSGASTTAISTGVACSSLQVIKRPYLLWSRTTGIDLVGHALPTVTTRTDVNATGDPTTITATTTLTGSASDTYTKVTTNDYWPDNTVCTDAQTCSWVLGRVRQTSTRSTVPSAISSTSAGSAANATATTGNGSPPPLNAAVLSAIFQLLLDD